MMKRAISVGGPIGPVGPFSTVKSARRPCDFKQSSS
jgi:hypothetical protein